MATQSTETRANEPDLSSNLINTLFIAPRAQTNIFDLDYQLYLFELLHQVFPNRWSHYIGITLSPLFYYSLGLQVSHLDILFLVLFAGMHLGMALKNHLTQLVPLILAIHGAFWLLAYTVGQHVFSLNGPWYLNPVFHILFWPTLQAASHALEARIPPPWGGTKLWAETRKFLTQSQPQYLAAAIILSPMYAFLELISTPRLFFMVILRIARITHLTPDWLKQLDANIEAHIKEAQPALALEDFDAIFTKPA
jgi:hypothetical protein